MLNWLALCFAVYPVVGVRVYAPLALNIAGNTRRDFISDAPFICQLKELTVWGFFTSEVGAKQVLRYNPMPMKFDGHFPRSPGDTTWAPNVL